MEANRQDQTANKNSNGISDFIETVFGLDQKLILKILNFTCLFLALVSFTMSYIAYQYNEMLHLKLLLSLAVMLVIFSGLIFWYIPKFEEYLEEAARPARTGTKPVFDKKND
ncbi:hypothetical protein OJ253_1857 [Cryptosporidium canis]|uniref:Uncharacterized protein n=1 Tax=Cryptosporidium canis TaxID=195482 RepID=A0A9D5DMP9_9CRYT|nr:hypothetical protein OJ253_1857 [Cryptosporidium canis]